MGISFKSFNKNTSKESVFDHAVGRKIIFAGLEVSSDVNLFPGAHISRYFDGHARVKSVDYTAVSHLVHGRNSVASLMERLVNVGT